MSIDDDHIHDENRHIHIYISAKCFHMRVCFRPKDTPCRDAVLSTIQDIYIYHQRFYHVPNTRKRDRSCTQCVSVCVYTDLECDFQVFEVAQVASTRLCREQTKCIRLNNVDDLSIANRGSEFLKPCTVLLI